MKRNLVPTTTIAEFEPFIEAGVFSVAEIHSAENITRNVFAAAGASPEFRDFLAIAVAVWAPTNGHVCADLDRIDEQVRSEFRHSNSPEDASTANLPWPDSTTWSAHLEAGPLCGPATEVAIDIRRPLVLSDKRLYLTRQWIDEGIVAASLGKRLSAQSSGLPADAETWLAEVFGPKSEGKQYEAVKNALSHNTTVLLGGPGTGKTYTITAMLHAFHSEHAATKSAHDPRLRVALAAPTAKASRQIGSSISEALKSTTFPSKFAAELQRIGQEASTIHRLLGSQWQNRGRFRHNQRNFLPYDVVIIDEVSMVSLALMARLLEALAPETRLVLVGDGEQLKSVENGAVLPEIAALRNSAVDFPIVTLTENRRQKTGPNGELNRIGTLAAMMRHPETEGEDDFIEPILEFLREDGDEVTWIELPDDGADPLSESLVIERINDDLDPFLKAKVAALVGDDSTALAELARIRVLCGHRAGRYGVKDWNASLARHLGIGLDRTSPGLPLLNVRNDLRTGLVNGDTGIVTLHGTTPLAVFGILRQSVSDDTGLVSSAEAVAQFEPTSLESVEVSFATTVHKAQGSQYETAIVVCPPHNSPLATRELVYTAATRATHRLVIIGSPMALAHALRTRTRRESGLSKRILNLPRH